MKTFPLVVGSVPFGQSTLVFKKAKTFQIKKKKGKDGYYYEIGCKALNILCFSRKLSDMREELDETIRMLWQAYALADDSELSTKAILLKRKLLKTIEERSK